MMLYRLIKDEQKKLYIIDFTYSICSRNFYFQYIFAIYLRYKMQLQWDRYIYAFQFRGIFSLIAFFHQLQNYFKATSKVFSLSNRLFILFPIFTLHLLSIWSTYYSYSAFAHTFFSLDRFFFLISTLAHFY